MELGLRGKVALVAAASSGLGKATALALAAEGMRLGICSRDEKSVRAAAAEIEAARGSEPVLALPIDLSSPDGPERFVRAGEERFGRVDVLVANCGGPPPRAARDLEDGDWEKAIPLTLLSSTRLARAVLPGMRARRWGRIIFIESISVRQPIEGLALSTALRSAVAGYSKSLADEVAAEGITVNIVAPGSIGTARLESLFARRARDKGRSLEEERAASVAAIPARRLGLPEELAAAAVFLASERAAYITGSVLAVDGGASRSIA